MQQSGTAEVSNGVRALLIYRSLDLTERCALLLGNRPWGQFLRPVEMKSAVRRRPEPKAWDYQHANKLTL